MVFFHGGAYKEGCDVGPFEMYAGTSLATNARHPVVVVTANYRLGAFGWLAAKGLPGNYGLMDNIAALQWVQTNAAAFGGDPGRVTVWGESAGAGSVGLLLSSAQHAAAGLFHRAIMESNPAGFRLRTAAMADTYGTAFCAALGCKASGCTPACPLFFPPSLFHSRGHGAACAVYYLPTNVMHPKTPPSSQASAPPPRPT